MGDAKFGTGGLNSNLSEPLSNLLKNWAELHQRIKFNTGVNKQFSSSKAQLWAQIQEQMIAENRRWIPWADGYFVLTQKSNDKPLDPETLQFCYKTFQRQVLKRAGDLEEEGKQFLIFCNQVRTAYGPKKHVLTFTTSKPMEDI